MHSLYYSQNHSVNNAGEESLSERKQEDIRTADSNQAFPIQ